MTQQIERRLEYGGRLFARWRGDAELAMAWGPKTWKVTGLNGSPKRSIRFAAAPRRYPALSKASDCWIPGSAEAVLSFSASSNKNVPP